MTKTNKLLTGITALALTTSLTLPAFAATQTHYSYKTTSISINANTTVKQEAITSGGTTYMPIWYVQNALKSVGLTASWSGTSWNFSDANYTNKLNLTAKNTSGNFTQIKVNGTSVIKNVPLIQATDLYSHHLTTFFPIWYVQQLLNAMGFSTDVWNGTTWTLATPIKKVSTPVALPQSDKLIATIGTSTQNSTTNFYEVSGYQTFQGQTINKYSYSPYKYFLFSDLVGDGSAGWSWQLDVNGTNLLPLLVHETNQNSGFVFVWHSQIASFSMGGTFQGATQFVLLPNQSVVSAKYISGTQNLANPGVPIVQISLSDGTTQTYNALNAQQIS